jgi:alpha/beta superfamily hydrolase
MRHPTLGGYIPRMVTKGQFLERSTLIPVGQVVLEGVAHRGKQRPPLLVLPPRPEDGGNMDHVVCAELAWSAVRAGHPTLRFNHRGVGASQGRSAPGAALVEDAAAALELASENAGGSPVAVAALGGAAQVALALQAQQPRVCGLVLVSPEGVLPASLATVHLPLLVILGADASSSGRVSLATGVAEAGGQLELIEGTDATFQSNLSQVGRTVAGWLQRLSGRTPTHEAW